MTAEDIIEAASSSGQTIAVAESCTGGLIGAALTSVSGSSDVFLGGVISYANSAKVKLLNVDEGNLNAHGAVSQEVAMQMAQGTREALGSDIAVSVTGIAGPGGGSAEKPVGLVWIGVSTHGNTEAFRNVFDGDRDAVRSATVEAALGHLHRVIGV